MSYSGQHEGGTTAKSKDILQPQHARHPLVILVTEALPERRCQVLLWLPAYNRASLCVIRTVALNAGTRDGKDVWNAALFLGRDRA